ncbi:hypothetical protein [Edaphocola flava]|uniref:hypothetical protein n=1 Tax=Edaphocola flava TaxID=2499629 RepID=UPI00100B2C54|nr:hypothetical protein [Edaphocola flava]
MSKKIALTLLSAVALCSTTSLSARPPVQQASARPLYGPNVVRFTPVTVFDNSVGIGFAYERILDKEGKISVNIPIYLGINTNSGYYSGPGYNNNTNYSMLLNPGVKFYPAGQRRVTYALGASLFTMMGEDDYYYGGPADKADYLKAGIMINNYVHFNITPKFNLGLELGVGPSYINQYKTVNYTNNEGIGFSAQFGFHMGFRF